VTTVEATSRPHEDLEPGDCPRCERATVCGVTPAGEAVRVDLGTVDLGGEVVAMLEGRMTYARFGDHLAPRLAGRGVRPAPPEGLYVFHVCSRPSLSWEIFRVGGGGE
jgi:hypothetical protein